MDMDIHALIRAFLQQQSIKKLSSPKEERIVLKAGIVPFLRNPLRFYLMKPVAQHTGLPPPKFQICKGTRMMKVGGIWQDIASPPATTVEMESLEETALREGIEELGLVPGNILKLFDLGAYAFASTKSGHEKQMYLFAAEMASEDFSNDVAATTAARVWLELEEFAIVGRDDHLYILNDIAAKLTA